MSPLVVALTLVVAPPPSLPPAPQVAVRVEGGRLRPMPTCRDIDPHFVRYVAPPDGVGPLWGVERGFDPGSPLSARQPATSPRVDCPRLIEASRAP